MVKLSGFFKNISIMMLIIGLLIVYAFLRENVVGILFNGKGEPLFSISRNQFFYYCLGLAIIYHVLFHLFKLGYLTTKSYAGDEELNEEYKNFFIIWWNFVGLSVNLFYISFLVFTGLANNAEDFKFSSISFIPITGVVPLILLIIGLPMIYFIRNKYLKKHPM